MSFGLIVFAATPRDTPAGLAGCLAERRAIPSLPFACCNDWSEGVRPSANTFSRVIASLLAEMNHIIRGDAVSGA